MICQWCGAEFTATGSRGPKPLYCKQAHRQRAYEMRKLIALSITKVKK